MTARKTADVATLRERGNRLLRLPDSDSGSGQEFRWGVVAMLEGVLHDTGNYHGFQYHASELAVGDEPTDRGTILRLGYDNTRRYYF
jgi:hypothetical protein